MLLHRALRELIKEKQLCAVEVEDMRSHNIEKESNLVVYITPYDRYYNIFNAH